MSPEETTEPAAREIRIEGVALVVAGIALLALLSGAFYLGLRVGRGDSPPSEPAASSVAPSESQEAPPPATPSAGTFDRAAEPNAAEPQREVKPPPAAASPAEAASKPAPGDFFVQVFAGRDRRAAESVVRTLEERGYPVRLDAQREGRDALYKVRVGGYRTEDEARLTAERLKKEGEKGAWVTGAH